MSEKTQLKRKPRWLQIKLPVGEEYVKVKRIVEKHKLHTICSSGRCPNAGECWGRGTATFMILGNTCTRACKFCAVDTGYPDEVDWKEPFRVAKSVQLMKLKHCVITSVDRDDLPDGGSAFWAQTIRKVKEMNPDTTMEVLIPDFRGKEEDIQKVINAKPEVISHNVETIERLSKRVRSQSRYERSLAVLRYISGKGVNTKSGIMVGLGEIQDEVLKTMDDLRDSGVNVLTIGQYLQPTPKHLDVKEYVSLEQFKFYEEEGLKRGFRHVESGPMVRSSYRAEKHVE